MGHRRRRLLGIEDGLDKRFQSLWFVEVVRIDGLISRVHNRSRKSKEFVPRAYKLLPDS